MLLKKYFSEQLLYFWLAFTVKMNGYFNNDFLISNHTNLI